MTPEQIEKLLGGYATGTLTEAEQNELFQAAVTDQKLFDALACEQALKELLDDPASRAELIRTLAATQPAALDRFRAWIGRPAPWAIAGGVAAAVVIGVLAIRLREPEAIKEPVLMAKREIPALKAPSIISPPPTAKPAVRDRMIAAQPGKPAAPAETLKEKKDEESRPARVVSSEQAAAPMAIGSAVAMKRADAADSALAVRQREAGILYRILRRERDGSYTEAAPATVFSSGDEVRLEVEPQVSGYLTVVASGKTPLFEGVVQAGTWYKIPEAEPVRLGPPAGELRLTVTLSGGPVSTLAKVEQQGASATQPVSIEILLRHR